MADIEIVAWRSYYPPSRQHTIWQQFPTGYSGELESLVKYEDHKEIVDMAVKELTEQAAEIYRLKKEIEAGQERYVQIWTRSNYK